MGGGHVFGCVEAVEREQIDDLARHHLVGRDYGSDFAVGVGCECRKLEVKLYVGLAHVACHYHDSVDADVGACELPVFEKRLVEVAEVGVERVGRTYV